MSTVRTADPTMPRAWYRQFWPWFVIALPAISVVFSVATLVVAVRHADSLVRDDWYDAGMSINRDFDREREAVRLGLHAVVVLDDEGRLRLQLSGQGADDVAGLRADLACAWAAGRDRTLALARVAPGVFVSTEALPDGPQRWDVAVTPEGGQPDATWRLAGPMDLRAPLGRAELGGHAAARTGA